VSFNKSLVFFSKNTESNLPHAIEVLVSGKLMIWVVTWTGQPQMEELPDKPLSMLHSASWNRTTVTMHGWHNNSYAIDNLYHSLLLHANSKAPSHPL